MDWGMYAMVPWAGRIRDGLIKNPSGDVFQLPTNWDPPHAEHGFGFFSDWEIANANSTRLQLPAPYEPAFAKQEFEILENTLRWSIRYFPNGCALPAWVGFHPWFARTLARGEPAEVTLAAEKMLVRGGDMLPTGEIAAPKPPPWDDTFTGVVKSPIIRWPGAAKVTVESNAPWWVVYTEDNEGVCVEPQSAPPDAANLKIVGSHELTVEFTFSAD
jgi:aldose 1-epimerase